MQATTASPFAEPAPAADRPALPLRRASAVLMLPITHPLTLAATAHAALAGAAVWALITLSGGDAGAEEALVCAMPLALVLVLAAATCPHQSARCHALRLLMATALTPALLIAWAAALPLPLAPVVVALGLLFLLASHASAFGAGAWRAHRRAAALRTASEAVNEPAVPV